MSGKREHWSSRLGFVLASAGSAIGLGNIWKFPYVAGENGGAAFVLVYILSVLFIGLPIIYAEISIGKATQEDVFGAFKLLGGKKWGMFGAYCIITGVIILSFYSVVGGWTISYVVKSLSISSADFSSPDMAAKAFKDFVESPFAVIFYHFVFMGLTALIVVGGIREGIEKWTKILMPLLFLILIFLVVYSFIIDANNDFKGVKYLFRFDFSKITGRAILAALGQAFFSLSLGMGIMVTYGSYLKPKDDVVSSGFYIVFLDTIIALLAGLAIFPIIFAYGFNPKSGPGLTFITLPVIFSKMPLGVLFAFLFFLLLTIAALTSSISLLEVISAYLIDEKKLDRKTAVLLGALGIFLLGVPSAISFVEAKEGFFSYVLFNQRFFDFVVKISSDYMLPIGGMVMAIYTAWIYKGKEIFNAFLEPKTPYKDVIFNWWIFILKFFAGWGILAVFIYNFF
jgi:NSS family neurotransmitter:Na+ symporter